MRVVDLTPATPRLVHPLNLQVGATFRGRGNTETGERLFMRSYYSGYSVCVDLTSGVAYNPSDVTLIEVLPDAVIHARGVKA